MSKRRIASTSARKITQTAPAPASASDRAARGVVIWRIRSQPKTADMIGVSVKTAPVETGSVRRSASNIRMK